MERILGLFLRRKEIDILWVRKNLKNEFAEKLFEHGMTKTAQGCHMVYSQIACELKNMTPEEAFKARCQIPFEKLED